MTLALFIKDTKARPTHRQKSTGCYIAMIFPKHIHTYIQTAGKTEGKLHKLR